MKASAVAYPIQGLVKYHGLRDVERRIPFHDSVSMAMGPIHSHTTVEALDGMVGVEAVVDGEVLGGRAMKRVERVVDAVRGRVKAWHGCRVVSRNDFPQLVGLGSSSSGFAALAVAAAAAYGWQNAKPYQLTECARVGAASAARSVTGGVSVLLANGSRNGGHAWADQWAPPEAFPEWRSVVPLIAHPCPTDLVHEAVTHSPFFTTRIMDAKRNLVAMKDAVRRRDAREVARVAERDTLSLHAATMTAPGLGLVWRPATLAVIEAVLALRGERVPVWYSLDTGATPYLNTSVDYVDRVRQAVSGLPGVEATMVLRPAPAASLVGEHLF